MGIQTFWLERTELVAVGLRRYSKGDGGFDCEHGYHSALRYTAVESATYDETNHRRTDERPKTSYDDPRWPEKCEHCREYVFKPWDEWQDWSLTIFRRTDTGQQLVLHQGAPAHELGIEAAGPGACWDASWIPYRRGSDGIYLLVRLPDGHDWSVDDRASNCTKPDDDEHRCWVRHGDPRECRVTVDKNGLTCDAGAGSIASAKWHGFLRNGVLVE